MNDELIALVAALTGDATVSALVETRIAPHHVGEELGYPYIVYAVVSTRNVHALDRAYGRPRLWVQLDIVDKTFTGAVALSDAVGDRLNGYRDGTLSSCRLRDGSPRSFYNPKTDHPRIIHEYSLIKRKE